MIEGEEAGDLGAARAAGEPGAARAELRPETVFGHGACAELAVPLATCDGDGCCTVVVGCLLLRGVEVEC